jgi:hypothetical protein
MGIPSERFKMRWQIYLRDQVSELRRPKRTGQRRHDAQGAGVRFLAKDAAILQRLAKAPRAAGLGMKLDRHHQPATADFLHD